MPASAALLPEALAAVERVKASSEASEVHGLWAEQPGGLADWMADMTQLRDDLAAKG